MADQAPSDAPPSYAQATDNKQKPTSASNTAGSSSHPSLQVPTARNGIPVHHRRSMEDQARRLPPGWVRALDPQTSHQYFVDTTKDPPRSIWVHPYDDPTYLSSLSSEERERVEDESMRHTQPTKADIMAEHTDEEDFDEHHGHSSSHLGPDELPPRPQGKGKEGLGRKLKDKLTGTTHVQREQERQRRAEEEQRLYQQHMRYREAMAKAAETGQPQLLGKDPKDGKDIFVEPPQNQRPAGAYGGNSFAFDPYTAGTYTTPQAHYIRPPMEYNRQYGRGYGGGYGMPLALGGGLLGGMLLGDMLFF